MDRLVSSTLTWIAGRWEPIAAPPARTAPAPVRVLTWNVWFGGHMFEERAAALLAELERRRPDVIALQEVTPALLAMIAATPWVQAGYQLSDADGATIGRYGVVVLARVPVRKLTWLDLPSAMGRRLLAAELACGLTVATVHLESTGECAAERAAQLRLLQPTLARASDDVVLVGDLNFAPGDAIEEAACDPSFVDAWPHLHGDDPGYTVDTDVNAMRYLVRTKPTHKRIDRVLVRSARWRPQAIERVGLAPIDVDLTFVSDHFGLEATLDPV